MQAAIIAAGLGERLVAAGITQPKPLVEVAGQALIDYALAGVSAAGITDVACIVNEMSAGIEDHCRQRWPGLRFAFVRRTTPSSMESLFTLSPLLGAARFLLLTTDSVCSPDVVRSFVRATARHDDADGVLALSGFVDDEKPLWAHVEPDGRLTALGPEARDSGLVTAGFYVFDAGIFREIDPARQGRFTALRQFLGHLLTRGYRLYGEPVGKTVDVDRPEDLGVAEAFVRGGYRE